MLCRGWWYFWKFWTCWYSIFSFWPSTSVGFSFFFASTWYTFSPIWSSRTFFSLTMILIATSSLFVIWSFRASRINFSFYALWFNYFTILNLFGSFFGSFFMWRGWFISWCFSFLSILYVTIIMRTCRTLWSILCLNLFCFTSGSSRNCGSWLIIYGILKSLFIKEIKLDELFIIFKIC